MSILRFRCLARILIAAGMSAAVLHLAGCRPDVPASAPSSATSALAAMLSAHRWIEPRLTGGSVHEPCDLRCPPEKPLCEPTCPGRPEEVYHNLPDSVSLWLEDDESFVAERHAAAVLALIAIREVETTEKAAKMLETLADQNPQDAGIRSDLSAAFVVLAQRAGDPVYLPRAMKAADEAIRLAPSSAAARFNRALASTRLALWPDAKLAWSAHLEHESGPGWAEEARQRQEEIFQAADASSDWPRLRDVVAANVDGRDLEAVHDLVDRYRTAARRWIEQEVLPAWAEAALAGRMQDADLSLALARRVSEELAARTGDALLLDAVGAIEAADGEDLRSLAAGHAAYGNAVRQERGFEIQAAKESYRRAQQALARVRSPFLPWAEVGLAVTLYQDHDLPAALELLAPLREAAERNGYDSLAGRVWWIMALCQTHSSLPTEAAFSYQSALNRSRDAGELEVVANVQARLAEIYLKKLGQADRAWLHRFQALWGLRHVVDPHSRIFILTEAADGLGHELPQAAYALRKEALLLAQRSEENPVYLAITLRSFAESRLETGEREEILDDLGTAFRLSGRVPHTGVRLVLQARIRALEGRLYREGAPARAIQACDEALDLIPKNEFRGYRASLYLERASALLAANEKTRAMADLEASVAEIEAEWQQVTSDHRDPGQHEALGSTYFGQRKETFEAMVALQAGLGRVDDSFTYAEKARARDLIDLIPSPRVSAGEPFSPLTAQDVPRRLLPGTVLVEYALLEDRLLTWIARRGAKPVLTETLLDRTELEMAVASIHQAAEVRHPDLDPQAVHRLHALLVKPVLETARPGEKLVFVPDGAIHGVPFAALRPVSSGRYLIQDHPIAVSPSATLYVYAEQRNREMPRRGTPRALLIGDPAFDPGVHLGLKRLEGAALETQEVATLYRAPKLLIGDQATKEAFLALWEHYDVVHFAGHAISDPAVPLKSMLVLASSDARPASGALYAAELFTNHLPSTRLVVLSACSTAGGHAIGTPGVVTFVRPILGAGVPAVVGSLWDVSDLATRELLTEFHRRLNAGAEAATALQQAQCALLDGDNRALATPFIWASFQVVGSASLTDQSSTDHNIMED